MIMGEGRTWSTMQVLAGIVVGSFLGGAGAVIWGDARYVRQDSYQNHVAQDEKVQYATINDLEQHKREGHDFTKIQLTAIQAQLASIQTDLGWLKAGLQDSAIAKPRRTNADR